MATQKVQATLPLLHPPLFISFLLFLTTVQQSNTGGCRDAHRLDRSHVPHVATNREGTGYQWARWSGHSQSLSWYSGGKKKERKSKWEAVSLSPAYLGLPSAHCGGPGDDRATVWLLRGSRTELRDPGTLSQWHDAMGQLKTLFRVAETKKMAGALKITFQQKYCQWLLKNSYNVLILIYFYFSKFWQKVVVPLWHCIAGLHNGSNPVSIKSRCVSAHHLLLQLVILQVFIDCPALYSFPSTYSPSPQPFLQYLALNQSCHF